MSEILEQKEAVNVALSVVWHGAAGKFESRVSEISLDGCFIDSMGQEVMGEAINFNIKLPSGIWASLQGEVTYQEYPVGFELRFTDLKDENKRLLTQVIAEHGGKQAQEILRTQAAETPAASTVQESKRILIADDDVLTLKMLAAILEADGYEVISVADGREAFRILQKDADFCSVIFDMMMPHLDGLDLINYMKSDDRTSSIPIGVITGEQDPMIWDNSIAAGASVFLPKPFSPPQIQMMLLILVRKTIEADAMSS